MSPRRERLQVLQRRFIERKASRSGSAGPHNGTVAQPDGAASTPRRRPCPHEALDPCHVHEPERDAWQRGGSTPVPGVETETNMDESHAAIAMRSRRRSHDSLRLSPHALTRGWPLFGRPDLGPRDRARERRRVLPAAPAHLRRNVPSAPRCCVPVHVRQPNLRVPVRSKREDCFVDVHLLPERPAAGRGRLRRLLPLS